MTGRAGPDLSAEPAPDRRPWPAYLHPGAVVVVPAAVAAFLIVQTDMPARRVKHRGEDPQLDSVLAALTVAGLGWRTSAFSAQCSLREDGRMNEHVDMGEAVAAVRRVLGAVDAGEVEATPAERAYLAGALDVLEQMPARTPLQ